MADPILDHLWRVREELIKKYGGMDGLWKHIQKVDRAHRRRRRRGVRPAAGRGRRGAVAAGAKK